MLSRRMMVAGGALTAGLGLAGCGGPGSGTAHLRFKVIARARLGGGDYEGFAVNEMKAIYTPNTLSGFKMGRTLKMEATVLDFKGNADSLFILLTDYLEVILRLWEIAPSPGSADETTIPKLRTASGRQEFSWRKAPPGMDYDDAVKINVLSGLFPKIAAFRDEGDPASVYEVNPDNLAKTHGPAAKFLGLSIEIVDPKTPLTESIEQKLGWLIPGASQRLVTPPPRQSLRDATFAERTAHGSFKDG